MRVLTSTITMTAALLLVSTLPRISCNPTPSLQLEPRGDQGYGALCFKTSTTCKGTADSNVAINEPFNGCAAVDIYKGRRLCAGCSYNKANCLDGGVCVNMQGNNKKYNCVVLCEYIVLVDTSG